MTDKINKLTKLRQRYVVKSNHLITRVCQLSPKSQKLFTIFVALMNSDRAENNFFWLTLREISELLEIDKYKNYRREIIKMINELENGKMFMLDINTASHFVSSVKFTDDGRVYFEFPNLLINHVGKVKSNYTKYQLKTILPLKGAYSLKIYEILKKDAHRGRATYDLTYFREFLGVQSDKYIKFDHFKKRVLLSALNEINEKTELTVHYKLLKQNGTKTFIGIEFDIVTNHADLKEFEEKIQTELKLTGIKRFDPEQIPLRALNSPAFNTVYENFIENRNNFPAYFCFENYIEENGFKIICYGDKGGKDLTYQSKMKI